MGWSSVHCQTMQNKNCSQTTTHHNLLSWTTQTQLHSMPCLHCNLIRHRRKHPLNMPMCCLKTPFHSVQHLCPSLKTPASHSRNQCHYCSTFSLLQFSRILHKWSPTKSIVQYWLLLLRLHVLFIKMLVSPTNSIISEYGVIVSGKLFTYKSKRTMAQNRALWNSHLYLSPLRMRSCTSFSITYCFLAHK